MALVLTVLGKGGRKSDSFFHIFVLRSLSGYLQTQAGFPIFDMFRSNRIHKLSDTREKPDSDLCICCGRRGNPDSQQADPGRRGGGGRMVFCHFRSSAGPEGKYGVAVVWGGLVRHLLPSFGYRCNCKREGGTKIENSFSAVSFASRYVDGISVKPQAKSFPASFTVEAALVMAVAFWVLGFMIKQTYILYDQVSGNMILQEAVENTRYAPAGCGEEFASVGKTQGNPRLWLGEYHITIKETGSKVKGTALAGSWQSEIEMKANRPERFLRRIQALLEKRCAPHDSS